MLLLFTPIKIDYFYSWNMGSQPGLNKYYYDRDFYSVCCFSELDYNWSGRYFS